MYPFRAATALIFLLTLTSHGSLLEDYDVQPGDDPTGGSYTFWDPGATRFFMNAAAPLNVASYAEEEVDGDGGEELAVSVPDGGRVVVLRYFNDTVNGPSGDPFYQQVSGLPVLSVSCRNPGVQPVEVSIVVETSGSGQLQIGSSRTLAPGAERNLAWNLPADPDFSRLLGADATGPLRLLVVQETPGGVPGTVEYNDFALKAPEVVDPGSSSLDLPTGEWTETPEFGSLFGVTEQLAWSSSFGWIWHAVFPWIYLPGIGWTHALEEGDTGFLFHHGNGYLYLDPETAPYAYVLKDGDWIDIETGLRYYGGSAWMLSVPTEQPEVVPGDWFLSSQPKPSIASILSKPDPEVPVYGLYCWASEYLKYRDFIHTMGWRHFRLSGPINDQVVRAYSEDGARVMFTIAARDPFTSVWRNAATYDTVDDFIDAYLGDITRVLDRYGPSGAFWDENPGLSHQPIEAIEIFNEPNFWYMNMTKAEKDAGLETKELREERVGIYARLLSAAHDHIKENWPSIRVVGFATGGAGSADVGFIEDVHNHPAFDPFSYDVLSTHPYVRPVAPEVNSVRRWGDYSLTKNHRSIRSIMTRHGGADKPIWWTELGWSIPDGHYSEEALETIPRGLQAAYYIRSYARALRLGVERLTFMSIVDTDGVNFGMLERDGEWRPTAMAVRNMMELMPYPRMLAAVRESCDDRVNAYTFDPGSENANDRPVTMAWTADAAGDRLEVLWGETAPDALTVETESLEVIDMLGQATTFSRSDGPLAIQIGPFPIFIRPID